MNKVVLIVCDGLSDRPIKELGNKTPLEAASKPNIDQITKQGITGLMHTVDIGVRPGSDVAHLSLFGYDINKYYCGRGPFEAAGYGLKLLPNDIAFRGNFATVDKNFRVIDRRAGRIKNTDQLIKSISKIKLKDIQILIAKGVDHRLAIVLRGKNLSSNVSDTDPHLNNVKINFCRAVKKNRDSQKTAEIINYFSLKCYEIFDLHPLNKRREKKGLLPANIILLRGAGKLAKIPSFKKMHGFRAVCIAGGGLYKGIGNILGMTVLPIKRATGKVNTSIKAKIKAALEASKKYDFIFIHIKAGDSPAEDGNFFGKKKFIEKIDQALFPFVNQKDILFVLTADHTTSSLLKIHTADPVPVLISGRNIHTDQVKSFNEKTAALGKLGHIRGKHLMPIIKDFLGRAPLIGA